MHVLVRKLLSFEWTHFYLLVIVMVVFSPAGVEADVSVFEVYTCEDYDEENHWPLILTSYFDVSSPGTVLWFNASYVLNADVSVRWVLPGGAIYFVDNLSMPVDYDQGWVDGVSFMPIVGEEASRNPGLWGVELYFDDVLVSLVDFNVIDKEGPDWGFFAEIVDVNVPGKVYVGQDFTVEVVVDYDFASLTLFTPGLWDPVTEDLIVEDFDEVEGEGIKAYSMIVPGVNSTGVFSIDAAAFYMYDDEWFLDDEGLVSFDVNIEERESLWFIPGYPISAILIGLVVSLIVLRYSRRYG
jgi:hypothetical protein